ncbi:hypothetical protein [Micromonospora carbonacea]|uniref:hypothetical protein n=1 Tax=Micromonospora carbonacea TaxID=47853 RepID=UPI00114D3ABF|nr:hypothetical protein [Micromonospora carbonacea]
MADRAFVGLPAAEDLVGECTYSAAIDKPACGQPAAHHVVGRAEGWGWVSLNACSDHLSIAVAGCAEVRDVHGAEGCSGVHYKPAGEGRG